MFFFVGENPIFTYPVLIPSRFVRHQPVFCGGCTYGSGEFAADAFETVEDFGCDVVDALFVDCLEGWDVLEGLFEHAGGERVCVG